MSLLLRPFIFCGLLVGLARAEVESWKIDYEQSSIEIAGKALGFVPSVFEVKTFEADVKSVSGPSILVGAEFVFSYADLSSGYSSRDRKIHEWLEVDRHPEGRFSLLEVEETGEGNFLAIGELTLHGVTREARFDGLLKEEDGRLALEAMAEIDYREWGLPPLRILLFKVRPVLEISLRVEEAKAP